MKLRKLAKRVVNKIIGRTGKPQSVSLIEGGYIEVGAGCDLQSMTVFIFNKVPGKRYIKMGDNCCVRGTIILYRDSSEIILGNNVYVGPGTYIECAEKIQIGSHVLISMNCNLIDTNSHSLHSLDRRKDAIEWQKGLAFKDWSVVKSSAISIGNDCWVGLRSIIMKGVQLGTGTIVAAGSVVTKSTNSFDVIAGNPATVIRKAD
jgi:acetyltransferase-like isoleucine patch superfamily enzyme